MNRRKSKRSKTRRSPGCFGVDDAKECDAMKNCTWKGTYCGDTMFDDSLPSLPSPVHDIILQYTGGISEKLGTDIRYNYTLFKGWYPEQVYNPDVSIYSNINDIIDVLIDSERLENTPIDIVILTLQRFVALGGHEDDIDVLIDILENRRFIQQFGVIDGSQLLHILSHESIYDRKVAEFVINGYLSEHMFLNNVLTFKEYLKFYLSNFATQDFVVNHVVRPLRNLYTNYSRVVNDNIPTRDAMAHNIYVLNERLKTSLSSMYRQEIESQLQELKQSYHAMQLEMQTAYRVTQHIRSILSKLTSSTIRNAVAISRHRMRIG